MKKRLLRIGAALVVLLLIAAGLIFWSITGKTSGRVELWIGQQIQTIAGAYLKPKLSFTDPKYTYPLAVSLKNFKLTADDPSHPGQTVDILSCDSAELELASIPAIGKPIVIEKISLKNPQISAIATEAGKKEFIGFSDLLKPGAIQDQPENKPAEAPTKISDMLKMKLVEVIDAKIVYDARLPGTLPMSLDKISTTLNINATSDGWYKLNTLITRKPVFDLAVAGELNLDSFTVRGIDIKMTADLGQEKLDYLPPEIQQLLKQYDGKGKLDVAITGTMPVMDPMKGDMTADVKLDQAHVAMGDFHLPVDDLELKAHFADSKVTIPSIHVASLGGTADVTGSATLNDRLDADLSLAVKGMVLENLLKAGAGPNAAKLDLNFKVAGSLMAILGKVPPPAAGALAALSVQNFHLTANDPVNAGQTVDVVAVKNLDIALAEPVVTGKPIVIEKVILDEPVLSAIAVSPNSFHFVGVPSLPPSLMAAPTTKPIANVDDLKAAVDKATVSPLKLESNLSDLIRVKTFQLNNAKVVYDAQIPSAQRMWLDKINTALNEDPTNPGVYALSTNISRKPAFDLNVGAKIDIDHPAINDLKIDLLADLTQGQTDFLVPQLQAFLKASKATGTLTFNAAGSVPFSDLGKADLHIASKLDRVNVIAGDQKVAVQGFKVNVDVAKGQAVIKDCEIDAAGSVFNLTGTVALSQAFDTDLTLHVNNVPIERLLGAVKPGVTFDTTTLIAADVQIRSAALAALNGALGNPGQSLATVTVKNFSLATSLPDSSLAKFVACDSVEIGVSQLPLGGKPVVVDHITIEQPMIRAVAVAPGSNDIVGVVNLQKIAAKFSTANAPAATQPAPPAPPAPVATLSPILISDLVRVDSVKVNNAKLYYDPLIAKTTPLSMELITASVAPVVAGKGDVYGYKVLIPNAPDFTLDTSGHVNIDKLTADTLRFTLDANLSKHDAAYFPPQIQQLLAQYAVKGDLKVDLPDGSVPLTDPTAAVLTPQVRIENLQASSAGFTVPVPHVRLQPVVSGRKIVLTPTTQPMGGPTADVLGGSVDLVGTVLLDDQLHATLDLGVKDVKLQQLPPLMNPPNPQLKDLAGNVILQAHLEQASLLVIAARAAPLTKDSKPDPLRYVPLPDDWGGGMIRVTDARLAGLELVQMMGNAAKSVFFDLFAKDKEHDLSVKPKEHAEIDFRLLKDRVVFDKKKIYYEGEVVAVEGEGYIGVDQTLNLTMRGGPWGKLGNVGTFGQWVSSAGNSLLTFKVDGTVSKIGFHPETGDGKPILDVASTAIDKSGEGIGKGAKATTRALDTAGDAVKKGWNKLFGK